MTRKRLGDLLVESGLITTEQLEEALKDKAPDEKLGKHWLRLGMITEQQLIEVLEFQLGVPHISINQFAVDPDTVQLVPREIAKRYQVMPIRTENDDCRRDGGSAGLLCDWRIAHGDGIPNRPGDCDERRIAASDYEILRFAAVAGRGDE